MASRKTIAAFRYGWGLPLPAEADAQPAAMLARLAGPDLARWAMPGAGLAEALPLYQATAEARRNARRSEADRDIYRGLVRQIEAGRIRSTQVDMARALSSADGLRERLVRFWADHFTTLGRFRQDRVMPQALVEDAIRPFVAGRFSDMLKAATLHPAMLLYLDQVSSIGPDSPAGQRRGRGLNENLARELIELHTLGVGAGYGQDDVRQMAELLTGIRFNPLDGVTFDRDWAEPGAETVLGKIYEGNGLRPILRALNDLALRPETAEHLARKLATHFVADEPDPGLVAAMATAYAGSRGNLLATYTAMLDHPAAWAPPLAKARQPYDFMVAALRALGYRGPDVLGMVPNTFRKRILLPMRAMGQAWGEAPGPDGWPEEVGEWITPQGLSARITWAMDVPIRLVDELPDPATLAQRALGDLAGERLLWAVSRAEGRREGVGLVLASPEFNRR